MSAGSESILGRWKITECLPVTPLMTESPIIGIEGAIFTLQESGELIWEIPGGADADCPLFECDCFEVICSFVGTSIQMGAVSGHIFEFYVDRPPARESMKLTFEGWCALNCVQVESEHQQLDFPYSLLPAFLEGFFSDIGLPASLTTKDALESQQQRFKLHSVVLELGDIKLEELKGQPDDVLEVLLHYLYAQCLPPTLTMNLAERCIALAPGSMSEFKGLCQEYLYRMKLRNKLMTLVTDVHKCVDGMLQAFQHHQVTKPDKFCHVIKLALRHASVAVAKLVEACVVYGEEASKLTREERIEILRYAKSRLPLILNQFVALTRTVKNDFSLVKPSDRTNIASTIVPEVECILESMNFLMAKARDACVNVESHWASREFSIPGCSSVVTSKPSPQESATSDHRSDASCADTKNLFRDSLFDIFRDREMHWLRNASAQILAFNIYISQRKEIFDEMLPPSKIRCISRNLEQLIEELPVFLMRLEELMVALDDRFQWKDFRFCLQQAISQVCHAVHHLREERKTLQDFFTVLTEMVRSDAFTTSLKNLKLVESDDDVATKSSDTNIPEKSECLRPDTTMEEKQRAKSKNCFASGCELTLVASLCTSPKSRYNALAINAARLFNSVEHSDMVFEVRNESEVVEITSHRVVMAARCDWFRRALLSGMKESVQKRIVIHDCPIAVFRQFLRYVYTGQVGPDSFMSTECLCDLTALADRYEMDDLKLTCEHELILGHLDENSVVFLLTVADQFNARGLRRSCLQFIASNPGVMVKDVFEELTPELQMEVYDITMWSKANRKVFSTVDELVPHPRYMLVPDTQSSSSDSESYSASPS